MADLDNQVPYLLVLVTLQLLNSIHTPTHLYHNHIRIATIPLDIPLAALQDIQYPLEHNTNNPRIRLGQKVEECRHAAVLDEELDLQICVYKLDILVPTLRYFSTSNAGAAYRFRYWKHSQ